MFAPLRYYVKRGRLADKRQVVWLRRIRDWSKLTVTGDIAELNSVPTDAEIWGHVTSTRDNCIGVECDNYQECFIYKPPRRARSRHFSSKSPFIFC